MLKLYEKGHKNVVQYEEIVKGLTQGLTIAQQYEKFDVSNPSRFIATAHVIRKKIMRVYNVDFAIHGAGREPNDPDFIRMHVDDGTFWDILDLIQDSKKSTAKEGIKI